MYSKWSDRGSLNLEQSLLISLLVLAAAFTLFSLGDAVMCLYANEAVESAVAGGGPESAAGLEYAGRCVDIRHLVATDNGDGTVQLVWVGGEPPFTLYRSDTELVAFDAPNSPFLGVAYAAGTEVVPDLDGNDYDRVATVVAGYGQTWYQVNESGGDTAVADLDYPVVDELYFATAVSAGAIPPEDGAQLTGATFELTWSGGSVSWGDGVPIDEHPEWVHNSPAVAIAEGEPVTLRVSCPGYATETTTFIPSDFVVSTEPGDWTPVSGSGGVPFHGFMYWRELVPVGAPATEVFSVRGSTAVQVRAVLFPESWGPYSAPTASIIRLGGNNRWTVSGLPTVLGSSGYSYQTSTDGVAWSSPTAGVPSSTVILSTLRWVKVTASGAGVLPDLEFVFGPSPLVSGSVPLASGSTW